MLFSPLKSLVDYVLACARRALAQRPITRRSQRKKPRPALRLLVDELEGRLLPSQMPILNVTDNSATYNGFAFTAVGSAYESDGTTPVSGSFSFEYYVGSTATGPDSSSAPIFAGTYTVVADFSSSNPSYSDGSAQTTFTIGQATATLSVSGGGVYTSNPVPASATLTGVVASGPYQDDSPAASLETVSPTFTYYVGSSTTGTELTGAPVAAGTYTVVANFAGSQDYTSENDQLTFQVLQATPTVTVSGGGAYDGSPVPASATEVGIDGSTPVNGSFTYTYYVGSSASGPGSATAPTNAGTYTVAADFTSTNADYTSVEVPLTFNIVQATPTEAVSLAGPPAVATATATGVDGHTAVNGSFTITYYVGSTVSGPGTTTPPTSPGTYTALADFTSSDSNYTNVSDQLTFTLSQPTVTITAGGTYTGDPMAATATALEVDGVTATTGSFTYTYYVGSSVSGPGSSTAPTSAGTYTVVASFTSGNVDYTNVTQDQTFVIGTATPTVTVADLGGNYDNSPYPASAAARGIGNTTVDGSFIYTYYVGSTVSGSGSSTAPSNPGTYTVVANFTSSNSNYASASGQTTFFISQATPTVTLSAPAQSFLGEDISLSASFSNTWASAGFAPYVDVIFPSNGVDGNDGITFNSGSATYLGASVATTVLTFNSNGQAIQPDATNGSGGPLVIDGPAGDELVVFQLPFGSFTPGQPAVTINFTGQISDLARVGVPLTLQSFGLFALGGVATGNATIVGQTVTSAVTPTIVELTKTYLGPEQETATGPSFPQEYQISAAVAAGQTITSVDLSDVLPSNMQFVQIDSVTGNGSTTIADTSTPSTTAPGGTLTVSFNQITGTGNFTDAVLVFTFYIPEFDASGNPVLNPTTGAFAPSTDNASLTAKFSPLNPLDTTTTVSATAQNTITDKSIAIQKSVTDLDAGPLGPAPNDTLQYTLNFQISDFFAFSQVLAQDLMSDGQSFDTSFTPTITFREDGNTIAGDFSAGNFSAIQDTTPGTPDSGTTTVTFNIAQELADLGLASGTNLLGAGVPLGGGAVSALPSVSGTTGTITFDAVIDNYYLLQPSPGAPVVEGDQLGDTVTISGQVLSTANLSASGNSQSDGSSASVTIARGALTKSIYAINGNTTVPADPQVTVGSTVTYEITYVLPASDIVNYAITDYLPLPIFPASAMGTTFDTTVSAAVPAVDQAKFGPNDTLYGVSDITPTITIDTTANSVEFYFGNYKDPGNQTLETDILLTVQVGDEPMADGLFLTNQAHETEGSETGGSATANSIIQLRLDEPSLQITKGVVATSDAAGTFSGPVGPVSFSAPGSSGFRASGNITSAGLAATPITSNLSNIQANDEATFAIVVQNVGSGDFGAFNVTIGDTLPAGFEIPAGGLDLSVTDGDGDPLAYSEPDGSAAVPSDLFGVGIKLVDPSGTQGALASYSASSGKNIVIITYDLQAESTTDADPVQPLETLTNTAEVMNYTNSVGGPTFVSRALTASSTVTIAGIQSVKTVTSTQSGSSSVEIGQLVNYQIVETIPQGETMDAEIVDTMPNGLAYVDGQPLVVSSSLDVLGSLTPVITNNGRTITIDLGDIDNSADDSSVADTITFDYQAIVLNVSSNASNTSLMNTADFDYTNWQGTSETITASAGALTVIQPKVTVTKTDTVNGVANGQGQAGDNVTYTITLKNSSPAEAYSVTVSDPLPQVPSSTASEILSPTFTVSDPNGGGSALNAADFQLTGSDATGYVLQSLGTIDLPVDSGRVITITISGTLTGTLQPGETISNTASATWQDLSGGPTAVSPYDTPDSTTRTNTGGSTASFTVSLPTLTKTVLSTSIASLPGPNLVVGEQVTYQMVVTLPEVNFSGGLSLADTLPAGLGYVSSQIVSIGSAITGAGSPTPSLSSNGVGQVITFDFGTGVVDDSSTNDQITVDLTALVQNVAGNVSGTILTNQATLSYGSGTATASANVDVVEPALQIVKTVSSTQADDTNVLTYTLTISHRSISTGPAFDLVVSDPLASGLALVPGSVTTSAGSVVTGNGPSDTTVDVTDPLLALGSTLVITYEAELTTANAPGAQVTNTATLDYDHGPSTRPDSGNSSVAVTVNSNGISGIVYVDANNTGIYESGETRLSGIQITLTGQNYLGTDVDTSTTTNSSGYYSFSQLLPGSYTLSETQPPLLLRGIDTPGTNFGGTGSVVTLSPDISSIAIPLESNTTGVSYNFAERIAADLAVTKTVSDATPNVGDVIYYTVDLTNNGPSNATGVAVSDLLPAGLTFQSATVPTGMTYSNVSGTWTVGNLADGASTSLVVYAKVVSPNPTTNTATITQSNQFDQNTANNSSSAVETPQQSQVTLTKTVSNTSPNVGNNIYYTLTVSNAGPNTATNVVVTDPLPAGESFVSAPAPAGTTFSFSSGTDTAAWDVGSLVVGGSYNLTLTVEITGVNQQTNTATLTDNQYNPTPSHGTSTAPTVTPQQADLTLTKTVSNPTPNLYDVVTFTLTVNNFGPNAATNVIVSDPLVTGLGFVGVTGTMGSFNSATDSWSIPSLPDGASAMLYLQEQVLLDTQVVNTASIGHADQYDPDLTNLQASATVTPVPISSLSGYVFVANSGNVGLPGVTVTLSGTNVEGDAVNATATTASNGSYLFPDLLAGQYTISRTPPSNVVNSMAYYGTQGGPAATSGGDLTDIVLGAGVNGTSNNFTETVAASKYLLLSSTGGSGIGDPSDPSDPSDPTEGNGKGTTTVFQTEYIVTNTSNSSSVAGSLPWAVALADADTSGTAVAIIFASGTGQAFASPQTIALTGTLNLTNTTSGEAIIIEGPPSSNTGGGLILQAAGTAPDITVFTVAANTTAAIENLTIGNGGGVNNLGTLSFSNVSIQGDTSGAGGDIDNSGTLNAAQTVAAVNLFQTAGTLSNSGTFSVTGQVQITGGSLTGNPINIIKSYSSGAAVVFSPTDGEGHTLTYTAQVAGNSQLFALEQQYDLASPGSNYFFDARGADEEYLISNNGSNAAHGGYYVLMPNGNLYAWNGNSLNTSIAGGPVAALGASVYANPTQLIAAPLPDSWAAFDLQAPPGSANYYLNARGQQEEYLLSGNGSNAIHGGYYVLMPNGNLYAWNGVSLATTLQTNVAATLPTVYYENPGLLFSVAPAGVSASVAVLSGTPTVTVTDSSGYLGAVTIIVSASAGPMTSIQSFQVTFTDATAPVLSQPANQTSPQNQPASVTLSLTSGTASNYTAQVGSYSAAYAAEQQYGLANPGGNYYYNNRGQQEEYLVSTNGSNSAHGGYFFLMPNGNLYAWDGSSLITSIALGPVASLGTSVYANPTSLIDASLPAGAADYLDLQAPAGSNNYYFNGRGDQEEYLVSGNGGNASHGGYYVLLPNGNLYAWNGSSLPGTLQTNTVAALPTVFYENPSLLYSAGPAGVSASVAVVDGTATVSVTDGSGFLGTVAILVTASDGAMTSTQSFQVSFTDSGLVLARPANQSTALAQPANPSSVVLNQQASAILNVTTGTASTFSAQVGNCSETFAVEQQYGLASPGSNNYFNARGQQEEYLVSTNGSNAGHGGYYVLMPNGNLYGWNGSSLTTSIAGGAVAVLGTSVYANPTQLLGASLPFSATAYVSEQKLDLQAPSGSSDYYFNDRGDQEEYLISGNGSNAAHGGYYVLMPNGNLYAWNGSSLATTLQTGAVAVLPTVFYETPSLLYTAGPAGVSASVVLVSGVPTLTVTDTSGYVGTVTIIVSASDGALTSSQSVQFTFV